MTSLTVMTDTSPRQITDSRVLAALAHPLRRRLMDALAVDGPATASMLAELTGQAVGNISHHLHTLAASELIVEAPELAKDRRERWWRQASAGFRWTSSDFADDSTGEAIARAASSLNLERQVQHVRDWASAGSEDRAWWREGPFATGTWMHLTAPELEQLGREVIELLDRWGKRELPDDGAERRTVFAFAHGIPARP